MCRAYVALFPSHVAPAKVNMHARVSRANSIYFRSLSRLLGIIVRLWRFGASGRLDGTLFSGRLCTGGKRNLVGQLRERARVYVSVEDIVLLASLPREMTRRALASCNLAGVILEHCKFGEVDSFFAVVSSFWFVIGFGARCLHRRTVFAHEGNFQ